MVNKYVRYLIMVSIIIFIVFYMMDKNNKSNYLLNEYTTIPVNVVEYRYLIYPNTKLKVVDKDKIVLDQLMEIIFTNTHADVQRGQNSYLVNSIEIEVKLKNLKTVSMLIAMDMNNEDLSVVYNSPRHGTTFVVRLDETNYQKAKKDIEYLLSNYEKK